MNLEITPMPKGNVVLTDQQAQFVEKRVSSGRYQNASEVLREGLRLIEGREAEDDACLRALRDAAAMVVISSSFASAALQTAASISVFGKSAPLKSGGSPVVFASAYEKQSP